MRVPFCREFRKRKESSLVPFAGNPHQTSTTSHISVLCEFNALTKQKAVFERTPASSAWHFHRGGDAYPSSSPFQLSQYTSCSGTAGVTNTLVIRPGTGLRTRSCFLGATSAGNEVCVSAVCLLPKSPRPITGFRSDCVAAIISSRSGPDCQLNTQFAVVNSHHL